MTAASAVLLAVAKELAGTAKENLPKLRHGEVVQKEWYDNGVFYRKSIYQGETYISQYDFRQRKSRRAAVFRIGDDGSG